MTPTPYCNNLRKDDTVQHADSKRVGKVAWNPRETVRMVGVIWQGTRSAQTVDVMKLRLVVNGQPEDVPPIDGEPPPQRAAADAPAAVLSIGIEALRKDREKINDEMTRMEQRFKQLRTQRDRLDRAITVLTEPVGSTE